MRKRNKQEKEKATKETMLQHSSNKETRLRG